MENLVKKSKKSSILDVVLELHNYRSVLIQLIRQYLRLKYRRTVFGYFWTLINPILMLFVLGIVFSSLLKVEFFNFILILFAGLLPWNMFSQTIIQSLTTYLNNEDLIKKIYIPKILFPVSVSVAIFIDSLIFFIVIFPVTLFFGTKISFALIILPLAYLLLFIFSLSISILGSIMCVFFRDVQWLIPVLLQALFFLTPILYEKVSVTDYLGWFNSVNPLTPFIDLFKNPIYYGIFPSLYSLIMCTVISLMALIISLIVFNKCKNKIIYRL